MGGIPEMIHHQVNGYVARERDAADFAQGIRYVLAEADYKTLSQECLHHVMQKYSQQSVANRYFEEYQQCLTPKKQNL